MKTKTNKIFTLLLIVVIMLSSTINVKAEGIKLDAKSKENLLVERQEANKIARALDIKVQGDENKFILDQAGVLSGEVKENVLAYNILLNDYFKDEPELAVLTVQTLPKGDSIEDYSLNMFNEYGIGEKGANNGLLLVVAIEDREFRLQYGSGIEESFNSFWTSDLEKNAINYMKKEDFSSGIDVMLNNVFNFMLTNKNIDKNTTELALYLSNVLDKSFSPVNYIEKVSLENLETQKEYEMLAANEEFVYEKENLPKGTYKLKVIYSSLVDASSLDTEIEDIELGGRNNSISFNAERKVVQKYKAYTEQEQKEMDRKFSIFTLIFSMFALSSLMILSQINRLEKKRINKLKEKLKSDIPNENNIINKKIKKYVKKFSGKNKPFDDLFQEAFLNLDLLYFFADTVNLKDNLDDYTLADEIVNWYKAKENEIKDAYDKFNQYDLIKDDVLGLNEKEYREALRVSEVLASIMMEPKSESRVDALIKQDASTYDNKYNFTKMYMENLKNDKYSDLKDPKVLLVEAYSYFEGKLFVRTKEELMDLEGEFINAVLEKKERDEAYKKADDFFQKNASVEQKAYFRNKPEEYDKYLLTFLIIYFMNSASDNEFNKDTVISETMNSHKETIKSQQAQVDTWSSSSFGGGGGMSSGGGISGGW